MQVFFARYPYHEIDENGAITEAPKVWIIQFFVILFTLSLCVALWQVGKPGKPGKPGIA